MALAIVGAMQSVVTGFFTSSGWIEVPYRMIGKGMADA
jgi:hypothetical protein